MKRILAFSALCSLAATMMGVYSCDKEPEAESETLKAPANPSVTDITDKSAKLTWDDVENAQTYQVLIDGRTAVSVSEAVYEVSNLAPETRYNWKVRALAGNLSSTWVDGEGFATKEEPVVPPELTAPVNPVVSGVTSTAATLSWTASAQATGYQVEFNGTTPVDVSGTSHSVNGLTPFTPYTWRVRSIRGEENSEWMDGEGFTTKATPVMLDKPTNLSASGITPSGAIVSWSAPAEGYSYQVEINGKTHNSVPNVDSDGTSLGIIGLKPSTSYGWKVRTTDGGNFSEWVSADNFTTTANPTSISSGNYLEVDFNNGEEVWATPYAGWTDHRIYEQYPEYGGWGFVGFTAESVGKDYTITGNFCYSPGNTTVLVDGWCVQSPWPHISYYSGRWKDIYMELYNVGGSKTQWSDWWEESGTITITSLTSTHISGVANVRMIDVYESEVKKNPNPPMKNLKMTFIDVPLYEGEFIQDAGLIQAALASPDRTASFKRPHPSEFN